MAWTEWQIGTSRVFPGFRVKINVDNVHGWVHHLVAPLDEPNPDDNHIHVKGSLGTAQYEIVKDAYLVASVRVDGQRVINRRLLIEGINRVTGLNLKYQ